MYKIVTEIAGWLPAIILPAATILQFIKIVKRKTAEGVSIITWLLFGLANLGLYIYTEKFFEIQAILSLLLTAIFDFLIICAVFFINTSEKR